MPQNPNPAQRQRSLLKAAILEQQEVIERQAAQLQAQATQLQSLTTAVAHIAIGAKVASRPAFSRLVRQAGLERFLAADSADNPSGAPSTTTQQAKQPQATDDVNSPGAAPSTVNSDVTPKAVTDVENSNVAANAPILDNLQDVTKPTPGTDAPTPAAGDAAGTSTVTVGTPSTQPFDAPGDSGWTQARLISSLRLARLQIQAGIAKGEDLALGERIASSRSTDGEIAAQIEALSAVESLRGQQPAEQRRNLVPRAAAQHGGIRSASASLQTEGAVVHGAVMGTRQGDDEWGLAGGAEDFNS